MRSFSGVLIRRSGVLRDQVPPHSLTAMADVVGLEYNQKNMVFRRLGFSGLRVPVFSLGGCKFVCQWL